MRLPSSHEKYLTKSEALESCFITERRIMESSGSNPTSRSSPHALSLDFHPKGGVRHQMIKYFPVLGTLTAPLDMAIARASPHAIQTATAIVVIQRPNARCLNFYAFLLWYQSVGKLKILNAKQYRLLSIDMAQTFPDRKWFENPAWSCIPPRLTVVPMGR
jgi:hypothetical protein